MRIVTQFLCGFSVLLLCLWACFAEGEKEKKDQGWIKLFNGKDLEGWKIEITKTGKEDPNKYIQVDDGTVHMYKDTKAGSPVEYGIIYPDTEYSHYHLRFQFKWGTKKFEPRMERVRDAGLLYHMEKPKKVWPQSIECQIQEKDVGDCFLVYGAQLTTTVKQTGSGKKIQNRYVKEGGKEITIGGPKILSVVKESDQEIEGWNTVEAIVHGEKEVSYIINGHEVFHAKDLKRLAEDGETWVPMTHGYIGFQLEFAEVYYRNFEIKAIDSGPLYPPKADVKTSLKESAKDSSSNTNPAKTKVTTEKSPSAKSLADRPMMMPNMKVPEGFEIVPAMTKQFVGYPTLACFDNQGHLYVSDGANSNEPYASFSKNPTRAIYRLDDTDGDGVFDRSILFADKMTFPYGGVFYDGALYVASDPYVWRLEDTDGDGVADKREEVVGRFRSGGLSSAMHGGYMGPDGRLYFNGGQEGGYELKGKDGKELIDKNPAASVFRIRPDGTDMEHIACGAMGVYNLSFDPSGDIFGAVTIMKSPRGDGLMHWVYGGEHMSGRPRTAYAPTTGKKLEPAIMWGQTSPSGTARYSSGAFGPEYVGNIFTAHYNNELVNGKQIVTRNVMERKGATWISAREENFVESPDINCKFTDVIEDADGSMIVINTGGWFRIGCPTVKVGPGELTGGIYRVRKIGQKSVADPRGLKIDWAKSSDADIVKLLNDPRFAVRNRALETLGKRGASAVAAILPALKDSAPMMRTNVVWALSRIETTEAKAGVRTLLNDPDPTTQLAAIYSVGLNRDKAAFDQLIKLLQSNQLPVVRNAADALNRIGDKKAVPALLAAMDKATDRFSEHAVILALIELDDWDTTAAGLTSKNPLIVRGALFAIDQMKGEILSENRVGELLKSKDASIVSSAIEIINRHKTWSAGVVELCQNWLHNPNLSEEQRKTLTEILLGKMVNVEIQNLVGEELVADKISQETRLMLLDVFTHAAFPGDYPKSWIDGMKKCLLSKDELIAARAIESIKHLKLRDWDSSLQKMAEDTDRKKAQRIEAALATLLSDEPPKHEIFKLLFDTCNSAETDPVTKMAIARGFSDAHFTPKQLDQLIELLGNAGPVELPSLLRIFEEANPPYDGEKLVSAMIKSPGTPIISYLRIQRLLFKYPEPVQHMGASVLKILNTSDENQSARLQELSFAEKGGDPKHGEQVFRGNGVCHQCHTVDGRGGTVGPNLSEIGKTRTRKEIIEAIAFPSATIARGYEPMTFVSKKTGKPLSGIVHRITSTDVVILTPDKSEKLFPRDDVDEISPSPTSIMPQGFDRQLQPEDMRDIVSFLSSRVGKK